MANVFTLDALREEVEKEYAPIVLVLPDGKEVQLRNLVRLPKKERSVALEYLKQINELESNSAEGVDTLVDVSVKLLALVSDDGRALAKELGDDLSLVTKLLNVWMDGSQPGEAKSSPA